jgi:hypothetical protein
MQNLLEKVESIKVDEMKILEINYYKKIRAKTNL